MFKTTIEMSEMNSATRDRKDNNDDCQLNFPFQKARELLQTSTNDNKLKTNDSNNTSVRFSFQSAKEMSEIDSKGQGGINKDIQDFKVAFTSLKSRELHQISTTDVKFTLMDETSSAIFPFQTAKAMSQMEFRKKGRNDRDNEDSQGKFAFHKATALLQSSTDLYLKKPDVNNNEGTDDLFYDEIPFTEKQIEEFGGPSNFMRGFQTTRQAPNNGSLTEGNNNTVIQQTTESSLSVEQTLAVPFEKPVLEDINKVLAKYEDSNKDKGPKKKVFFGKKIKDTSSATAPIAANATEPSSTTVSTNSANSILASKNVTKTEDARCRSIVFGKKTKTTSSARRTCKTAPIIANLTQPSSTAVSTNNTNSKLTSGNVTKTDDVRTKVIGFGKKKNTLSSTKRAANEFQTIDKFSTNTSVLQNSTNHSPTLENISEGPKSLDTLVSMNNTSEQIPVSENVSKVEKVLCQSLSMDNSNQTSAKVSKANGGEKKKVVFTNKRRLKTDEKLIEENFAQNVILPQGENDKRSMRKRAARKKPRRDVASSDEEDDHNDESADDSDKDEDYVPDLPQESKGKKKIVFNRRQNRFYPIKPDSEVFKVPDTDKFLKMKDKSQLVEKSSVKKKKLPSFNQKATSQLSSSRKKTIPNTGSTSWNVGAELKALNKKITVTVLPSVKIIKQAIVAPAHEPNTNGPASDYLPSKKKARMNIRVDKVVRKPVKTPRGVPIKVTPHLPNQLTALSLGGQKVQFNPNKARPLLFQSRAEALRWDATSIINFLRMKSQLEAGEYVHPELDVEVEQKARDEMQQMEVHVKAAVRDLEYKTLIEKYILMNHENTLVQSSSQINEWISDWNDMSPISLNEINRHFNRLMKISVTFVMLKKFMYLAKLNWNMTELKRGMWAKILSRRANALLQHFRETFKLCRPFTEDNYGVALLDLVAEYSSVIEPWPLHQRVLITHSEEEEKSWTRREPHLVLTTQPSSAESCGNLDYEYSENDHKNMLILCLLLFFSNQIYQPIFLSRNPAAKYHNNLQMVPFKEIEVHTSKSSGEVNQFTSNDEFNVLKTNTNCESYGNCVKDTSHVFIQDEIYLYFDDWNFKVHPKQIKRLVETDTRRVNYMKRRQIKMDVMNKLLSNKFRGVDCIPDTCSDNTNKTVDFPEEITNDSRKMDIDEDIGGATVEDLKVLNTNVVQKHVGSLLMNLTNDLFLPNAISEKYEAFNIEKNINNSTYSQRNIFNTVTIESHDKIQSASGSKWDDYLIKMQDQYIAESVNESQTLNKKSVFEEPMRSMHSTGFNTNNDLNDTEQNDPPKTHKVILDSLNVINDENYDMHLKDLYVPNDAEASYLPVEDHREGFNSHELRLIHDILDLNKAECNSLVPSLSLENPNNPKSDSQKKFFIQEDRKVSSQGKVVPDLIEIDDDDTLFIDSELYEYSETEGSIECEFDNFKTNLSQDDDIMLQEYQ